MAPAIARVDGMPHPELIFLHSESADGCNARRVPPVSFDLKIVKAVTGCTNKSPTAADAIEDEVQEALTICGASHRSLRITLIANAFLEAEIDRLDDPAATSDFTVLAQRLDRHLVNRFPTDPSLGNDPLFRYPFL